MAKTTDCKHGIDVYEYTCWSCETNSAKQEALQELKEWILKNEPNHMHHFTVNLVTTEINRRIKGIEEGGDRRKGYLKALNPMWCALAIRFNLWGKNL